MSTQNKKKPAQANNAENLQEDKLQAIVLLDSYTHNFEPFSSTRAECLMPFIGGRCLLDNNIEYLMENEVKEIYLFCTKHHQQIKEYIEEKKWREQVDLHFLYNFKCQSLGDAMREIEAKGLIRSNFILVNVYFVIFATLVLKHVTLKIKNWRSGSIYVYIYIDCILDEAPITQYPQLCNRRLKFTLLS